MSNLAVTTVLAFAVIAGALQSTQTMGQTPAAQPNQTAPAQTSQAPATQPSPTPLAAGQTQPGSTPVSQKVIKDPAEYDAYMTALNLQDPPARAAAMEAFVKRYPHSIVLVDALEQAMAAYQETQNGPKLEETAKRILQLQPNHANALAVVVALDRSQINNGDPQAPQAVKEICPYAQTGMEQLPVWHKPEALSDADYQKARNQMTEIFNGAAGFCALQQRDYVTALAHYSESLRVDPNNSVDNYQLAIAYLEANPIDLTGLWYGAKAMNLAANNPKALDTISRYVKGKYNKYHGRLDDWDKFAAAAASQSSPPSPAVMAVLVPPAPTPCDVAVDVLRKNKPEELSLRDRAFILSQANCSSANLEAAEKVWQSIQALEKDHTVMLLIPVKVISATTTSVDVAIVDDENKAPDKADVHVQLKKPLPKPPEPGTVTKVRGFITRYTPDPFMFTMEQGTLVAQTVPAPKKRGRAAPKPMG